MKLLYILDEWVVSLVIYNCPNLMLSGVNEKLLSHWKEKVIVGPLVDILNVGFGDF